MKPHYEREGVKLFCGDCIAVMDSMPADSVDLVFGSPPYEDARTYGIDFGLSGQDWVDWMVEVFRSSLRVSRGLVAFVVEGRTNNYRYSATPMLLMADLHRAGICLRKPPMYVRGGIPGSGGPDFLKNRYEPIVCATNGGKLPWSNNTACGHPPKFWPGGSPSHRKSDGTRCNGSKSTDRRKDGQLKNRIYVPPELVNPGNWLEFPNEGMEIDCGPCGGGHLGSELAHENEAPFPEKLAEIFVKSFCPPDGIVLDPFMGSGTTAAVAMQCSRKAIGIDIRESQIELQKRRLWGDVPLFA